MRASDGARKTRSIYAYILDNETALWHETHRDVHPSPVTYDELLARTIDYGSVVRAADPDTLIAGPAAWGWPEYSFSAKDAAVGFTLKPDRRAHGDVPLLAWYLRKLREHEQKTGTRILDVVDVHFYPQAAHLMGADERNDPQTAALRIRSTRALWDPTYVDESWIKDTVQLIPRLRKWIADEYPGRGISIGEYNFGGESHMSGALALAEALGRFGQEGVTSAFLWTYPPAESPAYYAFRAYRNFDGKGGRFLDASLPTRAPDGTSFFASRSGDRVVAVLLNFSPDTALDVKLDTSSCPRIASRKAFTYAGGVGFATVKLEEVLPYSITVLDLELEAR